MALEEQGVNRCLLLTDGLANVGMTDRDELARHAGELRARGVGTSTFGVGEDFDEVLLQAMASAGGGHFYFIADAATIRDHITSEVGEALDVVARGVTLEVVAPDGVKVEALTPHPSRERAGRTRSSSAISPPRRSSGSSSDSVSRTGKSGSAPAPPSPLATGTASSPRPPSGSTGSTRMTGRTTSRAATARSIARWP